MKSKINLVFGASGLVGQSIKKFAENKHNFVFSSKSEKQYIKFDLNKNLKEFPYKKVNKCFFLASPRIIKKNLSKDIFKQEYSWLKKIINTIKIEKLIYLSSSSIYYNDSHIVGLNKKRCEKLIIKNKKKFKYYQIWRPFNLIGNKYDRSDHFHNILFKKMFIEKKNFSIFYGNLNDTRGYSSVDDFADKILKFSNKNKCFLKDYGNPDVIKLIEIVNLYNRYYFKFYNKLFKCKFLNKKINSSKIKSNRNNVYSKHSSLYVLKNYLRNSINVKKL